MTRDRQKVAWLADHPDKSAHDFECEEPKLFLRWCIFQDQVLEGCLERVGPGEYRRTDKQPRAKAPDGPNVALAEAVYRTRSADGLLFVTNRDRCDYLGKSRGEKPQWLKENSGKWRSLADVEPEAARLTLPVENKTNLVAGLAEPNGQISSHDVRTEDGKEDITLVDTPAKGCSLRYQSTSLSVPVPAIVKKGTTKPEPPRRADAATRETKGPKTETTPLGAMGRKRGRSGGRHLKKQKLPADVSKAGRKLSPERMRTVLDSLREYPVLSHAARKAGIHRKTLPYWIKRSAAGDAGYDIEWQGEIWRFHEHCQTAIEEAHDKIFLVAWHIAMDGVVYRYDEVLLSHGCEGPDAHLKDKNGIPVLESVRKASPKMISKMIRFLLEWKRPEVYGKHPKIDVPRRCGVFVIHGAPSDKPKNGSAPSVKARKFKAAMRMIRETKA